MAFSLALVVNTVLALLFGLLLQLTAFCLDIWRLLALGQEVEDINQKHVVISGCDSGFGYLLAIRLIKRGVHVYAGCLTKSGLESLEKEVSSTIPHSRNLHAFTLDVTQDTSVAKAKEFVARKLPDDGLWGVVCNAGIIGATTPDDWNNTQDFLTVMDVNFMGHVRMTHAFRPLMKEQGEEGGRLIYMCSMMGHQVGPYSLPYITSKHAAVAYADSLRTELTSTNLKVVTICPGLHQTNLVRHEPMREQYSARWRQLDADVRTKYGGKDANNLPPTVEKRLQFIKTTMDFMSNGNSVAEVLDAYENALLSTRPKLTYWVGANVMFTRVGVHFSERAQLLFTVVSRKLLGDSD